MEVAEEIPIRKLEFKNTPLPEKPEEAKIQAAKAAGSETTPDSSESPEHQESPASSKSEDEGSQPDEGAGGNGETNEESSKHHYTGTNIIAQLNQIGLDSFVFDKIGAPHVSDEGKTELNEAWNALFEKYGVKEDIVTHPVGRVVVANFKEVAKNKDALMEYLKKRREEKANK